MTPLGPGTVLGGARTPAWALRDSAGTSEPGGQAWATPCAPFVSSDPFEEKACLLFPPESEHCLARGSPLLIFKIFFNSCVSSNQADFAFVRLFPYVLLFVAGHLSQKATSDTV